MADLKTIAKSNVTMLSSNQYPGRGIIQGLTPDGKNLVQVYFIMGRSENSRNRIFIEEQGFVRTHPHDAAKMKDPSLIIYYPVRFFNNIHVVSNGDQTDTVYEGLKNGTSFENSLKTREFEPDSPNYTPRITGLIDLDDKQCAYKFSVIRSSFNNPEICERFSFVYEKPIAGFGHCVHTYDGDGDPLPSFSKIPYIIPLDNDISVTMNTVWGCLNKDNRVSLLVKFIETASKKVDIKIINANT
ncbi:MAG: inosine monophosphate cyclohydrolase [Spirochaetes bacterium GWF1_31_7]|nr:MAG: inosine monophosphate cyclohydrolase [Spirochaetes bacterium GWE1_32_154]OHD47926.1 MAG: inosine monophosphate cyclohydrolase [Spirochaetes bacterium GWE2_31_10]OHD49849.1 MAG: inosine monophosphate cyclohydrolase [Spirochaetes bacterium GWF1_31_7]HBD92903.1 inosine monophosphate cyclohydrolase [Spirochaetia bacterium]HBI37780.1 inosine monophosphate cyclohydrolase [Spirochaetia bacterium]